MTRLAALSVFPARSITFPLRDLPPISHRRRAALARRGMRPRRAQAGSGPPARQHARPRAIVGAPAARCGRRRAALSGTVPRSQLVDGRGPAAGGGPHRRRRSRAGRGLRPRHQAQSRHPRPRDPPGPHVSRAGALGHDGAGRRALRRRHGQHRHADGPPRADPVPLQAAGLAQGAARDDDRRAARPGGRQGAGARGARPRPGPGLHDPAIGGHRAELLRRSRRGGHRHRRRDLRNAGQAPAALDPPLGAPARRAVLAVGAPPLRRPGRRQAPGVRPLRRRAAGRHRSARSRPVASRRPLRPVAAGPAGRRRHCLGRSTSAKAGSPDRSPPSGARICPPSRRPTPCWSGAARMSWRSTSPPRAFRRPGA